MRIIFWVGLGSGLGGLTRVGLGKFLQECWGESFPWPTLLINTTGSFTIGLLAALTMSGAIMAVGPAQRQFLMTGFCGGFTTFSIFSWQTMTLLQEGHILKALLYSFLTLALSLAGVTLGQFLGARLSRLPMSSRPLN